MQAIEESLKTAGATSVHRQGQKRKQRTDPTATDEPHLSSKRSRLEATQQVVAGPPVTSRLSAQESEFLPFLPLGHDERSVSLHIGRDVHMDPFLPDIAQACGVSLKPGDKLNNTTFDKERAARIPKVMALEYRDFLRIVVTSANMLREDFELGDNIWYIHDLPRLLLGPLLSTTSSRSSPSSTFETQFFDHLLALGCPISYIATLRGHFDFSKVLVHLVTSEPRASKGDQINIERLQTVTRELGYPASNTALEICTGSIGNLNSNWLFWLLHGRDWRASPESKFTIVFPTRGRRQTWKYGSADADAGSGPANIGSHITDWHACARQPIRDHLYLALDASDVTARPQWVYVGSANLSASAWGTVRRCRRWETEGTGKPLNVVSLFLARSSGVSDRNSCAGLAGECNVVPYERPAVPYRRDACLSGCGMTMGNWGKPWMRHDDACTMRDERPYTNNVRRLGHLTGPQLRGGRFRMCRGTEFGGDPDYMGQGTFASRGVSSQLDADLFDTFCTIPDAATPTPTARPLPSSFLPMPAARTSTVTADSTQSLQLSPLSVFARAPYLTSAAASTTINPAQLHRDTTIDQDEALVISPTSTKSSPSPVWLTLERATGETEPSHSANPAMDMPERSMSNSPDLDISDPVLVERPDPTRKGSGDTVQVYLCPGVEGFLTTFDGRNALARSPRSIAGDFTFGPMPAQNVSILANDQQQPRERPTPLEPTWPGILQHAPLSHRSARPCAWCTSPDTVVECRSYDKDCSIGDQQQQHQQHQFRAAVARIGKPRRRRRICPPPIPRPTNTHTHTHTIPQPASALPPAPASIQDLRPPASLLRPIPGAVTLPNRFPMLSPGPNTLSSPPCPLPPVRPTFMRFIVPLRPGPMPLPLPLGGAGAAARTGVALNAAGEQLFGVTMVGEERDSGVLARLRRTILSGGKRVRSFRVPRRLRRRCGSQVWSWRSVAVGVGA
ncbi:hypothetical protein BKA62DRAFT_675490 [Auriculariales sp. MPI-PUGE-AT-0066]|nr:hypothetical protein BKA62DRAFT_675490 [Auriculariales sp. MPI-PUGE-AT-0066]